MFCQMSSRSANYNDLFCLPPISNTFLRDNATHVNIRTILATKRQLLPSIHLFPCQICSLLHAVNPYISPVRSGNHFITLGCQSILISFLVHLLSILSQSIYLVIMICSRVGTSLLGFSSESLVFGERKSKITIHSRSLFFQ